MIIGKHVDNRSHPNKFLLISNEQYNQGNLFHAPTKMSRYQSGIIFISSYAGDKINKVKKCSK